MIELTTGVAFLLTSMYGAGSTPINSVNVQPLTANAIGSTPSLIILNDKASLEKYLKAHFADTPILVEIARCESGFSQYTKTGEIVRGKIDSADVGIMQINERYHLENAKELGFDIHTVDGNIGYAKYLYDKYGSEPWNASAPCWSKSPVAMNK